MPPTKDASSNIYIPQTTAEWTGFIPNVAPPTGLYRMQEASGNLADSADTLPLTPSANPNNPTYQNTLSGWTSKGVGCGAGQPQNFESTSASLPDLSQNTQANSFAVLGYFFITAIPGSALDLVEAANGTLKVSVNASSHLSVVSGANTATGTADAINGSGLANGAVGCLLVVNKTKGTTTLYTNQEVIRVAPGTLSATKTFLYGGLAVNAADCFFPYGCIWIGANAEFTDVTAHALLAGLGFTMLWGAFQPNWNFQDAVILNQGTLSFLGDQLWVGTEASARSIVFAQDPFGSSALHLAVSTLSTQDTVWLPTANGTLGLISAISAGTTLASNGQVVFSNSNGVSFGINGSTLTGSIVRGPAIAAGTQTATSGTVVFSNSNNISFGLSGSTQVTASYNFNASAGTTSNNLNSLVFSNSNGVTFGLSGSTITANFSLATTANAIVVSAGTTSGSLTQVIFSNSNAFQFGLNGSTITAQDQPISYFDGPHRLITNFAQAAGSMPIQRVRIPAPLTATRMDLLAHLTVAGSTANSYTLVAGIYTFSGSTANSVSTTSAGYTFNSGSSQATNQYGAFSGTRWRTLGMTWNITPGEYMIAFAMSINGPAGTTGSFSFFGDSSVSIIGEAGSSAGNFTKYFADGGYSAVTASAPASFQLSELNETLRIPFPYFRLVGSGP